MDVTLKITDRKGILHEIEAPTDMNMSLMEVIRAYEIAEDGEIGVCGGMAMCASCQCYVISNTPLPAKGDQEEAMLFEAYHVKENSRLGCQIPITQETDGLQVILAPYP
ncbi:2Fe-2S iron-sulfur cluster-binding protein [Capnocytophaga catalasegens]|uniref:Ferredoxin n=1 Tax=Capnocytophaga catalasegens TaxID=1004260 RepID=A0AAV5ASK9_9FLAO|nr:2Fe-2S iron-sulfur cluster-binding protein [Capnocytophaga catalasegens]GIZ15669.1 ferredoxin [Capnocytophaga catalasegens]GJM49564.1 ferredoxin [Capnocytophaga catalasegens]GJM51727.1 ferredoxin [Capnocytophaga catalasegens]